jgi:hypothetical protein
MLLSVYAVIATVVAVVAIIKAVKWKIATRAITLFCKEKFRSPTKEEIADCTKRAADNTIKFK